MNSEFLVFTNTAGQHSASSIDMAREIARGLHTADFDPPIIYRWLGGCTDCTCAGQIHKQSALIEIVGCAS